MEYSQPVKNNAIKSIRERIYHAPRLDDAFRSQENNIKHGKTTVPIITLLSFIGGPLGFFGIVGLIGYWLVYFKNKSELEKTEEELLIKKKNYNISGDISEMKSIWLRYGPAISYITSITIVLFYIMRFFWENREN